MSKPAAGVPRPYLRPMGGWWRRDPFFVRYMWREATALAVLAYAVVLAVGLLRLSQGEAAWNGWLAALRHPLSVAAHGAMVVAMVVHAITWFEVMPKTMPMMFAGGKRVADATITRAGWAVALATNLGLWAVMWWSGKP